MSIFDRIGFQDYKGEKIFSVNFSKLRPEDLKRNINNFVNESKKNSDLIKTILIDVRDADTSGIVRSDIKKVSSINPENLRKRAIVGVNGPKKLLISLANTFMKVKLKQFDSIEDAREYLVS